MLKKIMELKKSKFIRNVTVVASGTVIAQVIAMLSIPIIARIYGPESIGILGVFVAITAIVTKISGLTYPVAIVLPNKDEEAKILVKASIYLSFVIAFLTLTILIFYREPIASLFNLEEIESYLFFIPLIIIFSVLYQVSEQWLIRLQKFKLTAKAMIYKSIIENLSKIGVGLYHPVAYVLISITAFSYLLHTLLIVSHLKYKFSRSTLNIKDNAGEMVRLLKVYKDFPLYRAPQELVNGISSSLPILLLASFFGPAYAGFYTISKKVLHVPTNLLSKSIGDVFYPRITQAANKREHVANLLFKATMGLAIVGIIPFGIVFMFGPWLFGLVLGEDWIQAGEYARWLSIWLYFGFINRPTTKTIPVLKLQGLFLFYEILTTLIRAGALFIGFIIFNDDLIAIILLCMIAALSNVILIGFTYYKARKYDVINIMKRRQ